MLTQTPSQNAGSRAGRPDNKDRPVHAALHSAAMGYSPFYEQSSFEHFTVGTFFSKDILALC
jgi:hypothetical protein